MVIVGVCPFIMQRTKRRKRCYEATNSANLQFERSILGHFSDPTPHEYLPFLPHFMSTPKMQISRVCGFIDGCAKASERPGKGSPNVPNKL